jgi:8-oxo-dGTP pyrophosphatase MutT (NUDIX family)
MASWIIKDFKMEIPCIINKKILWEGGFLRSLLIEYKDPRGKIIPWEAFQRVGVKGIVAVVPFTEDNRVVLVKQFRPPVERFVVEFPAGLNDRDEPLVDVAHRELLEETGYYSESIIKIAEGPLSSGASTEILTVFLATKCINTHSQRLDDVENIEVITLPFNDFYETLFSLQKEDTYIDLKIPGLFEIARRHCSEFGK